MSFLRRRLSSLEGEGAQLLGEGQAYPLFLREVSHETSATLIASKAALLSLGQLDA